MSDRGAGAAVGAAGTSGTSGSRRLPRIVVTGVSGQVGAQLQCSLLLLGEVIGLDSRTLDLRDTAAIRATLDRLQPDIVVNPAAYTAVDRAETDEAAARLINADAPAAMARWCAEHGRDLIHYSTDYVFDGTRDRPYREDDPVCPANAYGRTKRAGEEAIEASGCRHWILRTSWVYSLHGANFLRTMVRLARSRDALNIVADQWGAPTPASLLADVTACLVAQCLNPAGGRIPRGILNVAPSGHTSWFGYARHGLEFLHARTLQADEARRPSESWRVERLPTLSPIPASQYPVPAPRPTNSRLDLGRIEGAGLVMPAWDRILEATLAMA